MSPSDLPAPLAARLAAALRRPQSPHRDLPPRLVLVDVNFGGDAPQRVVTGAPNLYQYRGVASLPVLKVAFARAGAMLVDAYSDQEPRPKKKLKPSKIRGVESHGMLLAATVDGKAVLAGFEKDVPSGTRVK